MRAMQMDHSVDPKTEIMKDSAKVAENVQVMGPQVLVAVYVRPKKTAGGIFLTDVTIGEDNYQGKVGLVLQLGPLAFKEDDEHKFPVKPTVGDWVLFRVGDTFELVVGERKFRLMEDVNVRAILKKPDFVL